MKHFFSQTSPFIPCHQAALRQKEMGGEDLVKLVGHEPCNSPPFPSSPRNLHNHCPDQIRTASPAARNSAGPACHLIGCNSRHMDLKIHVTSQRSAPNPQLTSASNSGGGERGGKKGKRKKEKKRALRHRTHTHIYNIFLSQNDFLVQFIRKRK